MFLHDPQINLSMIYSPWLTPDVVVNLLALHFLWVGPNLVIHHLGGKQTLIQLVGWSDLFYQFCTAAVDYSCNSGDAIQMR